MLVPSPNPLLYYGQRNENNAVGSMWRCCPDPYPREISVGSFGQRFAHGRQFMGTYACLGNGLAR